MTVETELQEFVAKAEACLHDAANTSEGANTERFSRMRRIALFDASNTIARTPEALKLKASLLHDADYFDRKPTPGAAYLIRSLLRDIANWEASALHE